MFRYTKEILEKYVSDSYTVSEVVRKFGLEPKGGNCNTVSKYIRFYQIDCSHFTGRPLQENFKQFIKQTPLSPDELFSENSKHSTVTVRRHIIRHSLMSYKCVECSLFEWKGKKLSLHLDHINGIPNDHRMDNLRFLCPNCHSLTNTYGAKNRKIKKIKPEKINKIKREVIKPQLQCIDCKKIISKNRTRCIKCANKHKAQQNNKIQWPDTPKLIKMISQSSYLAIGKQLGVSDNAVRKRIKNHPI